MKDWTAFPYHQQVKHIYIFITRWKIQHMKIFALKMFVTSETQMLEQTASGPHPSNQRFSVPCAQRYFYTESEKLHFSHCLIFSRASEQQVLRT